MLEISGSVQKGLVHAGDVLCLLRDGAAVREMPQNGGGKPLAAGGA